MKTSETGTKRVKKRAETTLRRYALFMFHTAAGAKRTFRSRITVYIPHNTAHQAARRPNPPLSYAYRRSVSPYSQNTPV
ncbi:MAG: hypothetical protein LBP19_00755 [Treponema sp.]|nr:hypothetical protein [Treponema sp.]